MPGERECQQHARRADRHHEADHAARDGEQDALDERLCDDLPARRADRQPQRRLAAPRRRAREQQVGDVGAGDQQHQAADAEQDAQAAAVLLLHDADAAAAGNRSTCCGRAWMTSGIHFAGHPVS